jgi:acetolactate synthase I/II/III large subunit
MRVYEAIVKGLESVGVEAAFGGAGENAAGLLLATYLDTGLVEFQNPDYAAYARACGADGYTVETLEQFEAAFDQALSSGRPSIIDARITRWAIPHFSTSPDGTIAGVVEMVEERLRS